MTHTAGAPVKAGNPPGMAVAVIKGRDTPLMKGYGFADMENKVAVTPQTVFRIGSITKQFTSAAIMSLVQEGKLKFDDDISAYCDTKKLIPNRAHGYEREGATIVNSAFLSMDLPYSAGSLCSPIVDLAAWTSRLHSERVVNAASFREMTTPMKLTSGRRMTYGFGLTIDTLAGHHVVQHGGGINGFISSLLYFPYDTLTVVDRGSTSASTRKEAH